MDVESIVKERYSEGARQKQEALCCPVDYDTNLLKAIPEEILEKDYGCGDPSRYVKPGDTVLDLGSGGGKICFMAAQLAGDNGKVIGIDINEDMLSLARKYQPVMTQKLGGVTIDFVKGYIQDLALDVAEMEQYMLQNPVTSVDDFAALTAWQQKQRLENPLIENDSVDLVISNCVLNLVNDEQKLQLIDEIYRVLKPGGRIAISDIVSDRDVPDKLKKDPELWSGCISGVFQEHVFSQVFKNAGFNAISYDKWDIAPWQVVDGIEFRSVTLTAVKPLLTTEENSTVEIIYRGPFASVTDEQGNVYGRGERTYVSAATYQLIANGCYKDDFVVMNNNLNPTLESCCSSGSKTTSCC